MSITGVYAFLIPEILSEVAVSDMLYRDSTEEQERAFTAIFDFLRFVP